MTKDSIDIDNLVFRASSMGNLMTEPRSKTEILGETCKTELCKVYAQARAGISPQIESKYLEKGNKREEIGITYYALKTRQMMTKNETRLRDNVCTGLPDLFVGDTIETSTVIPDVKNSWDYISFLKTITSPIAKDRYWQGQTYMRLTGATEAHFAVCCINAPIEMVSDEKRRAFFKMGVSDEEDEGYVRKCLEIERSMIFDSVEYLKEYPFADCHHEIETVNGVKRFKDFVNIPWNERIHIMKVQRNQADIDKIETMAPHWRDYIRKTFVDNGDK